MLGDWDLLGLENGLAKEGELLKLNVIPTCFTEVTQVTEAAP